MTTFLSYDYVIGTALERRVLRFEAWDFGVRLDCDEFQCRASKRHAWKVEKRWRRHGRRENTMPRQPIPQEAIDDAMAYFRSMVCFIDEPE